MQENATLCICKSKLLKASCPSRAFRFSWERSLADKKHLLGGADEEVEKRRDSASTETTKPQSQCYSLALTLRLQLCPKPFKQQFHPQGYKRQKTWEDKLKGQVYESAQSYWHPTLFIFRYEPESQNELDLTGNRTAPV